MKGNYINEYTFLKGRGIRYAVLVDKDDNLKTIPYNFDYLTFLIGGISYIIRKEFIKGIGILLIQALLIFLTGMPFGILANFALTFVISFFTGKEYVKQLVKDGAIAFEEYKENGYSLKYEEGQVISRSNDKKGKRMMDEYKNSIKKQNTYFYIFGICLLVGVFLVSGYKFRHLESKPTNVNMQAVTLEDEESHKEIKLPEKFVLLLNKGDDLQYFSIVNLNEKDKKLSGKYYDGKVLVSEKDNDTSTPLNEIVKKKGKIPSFVFKKYFSIDKDIPEVKVNISDVEKVLPKLKESDVKEKFKEILVNSTKLSEEDYETLIKSITYCYDNASDDVNNEINKDVFLKYKEFVSEINIKENYDFNKGNYYELGLESIASKDIINTFKNKLNGNVMYYLNNNDVENNDVVKDIKKKVAEEEKKRKEEQEKEENNNNVNNSNDDNTNNSGSNSNNNNYRPSYNTNNSRPNNSSGNSSSRPTHRPTHRPNRPSTHKPVNKPSNKPSNDNVQNEENSGSNGEQHKPEVDNNSGDNNVENQKPDKPSDGEEN